MQIHKAIVLHASCALTFLMLLPHFGWSEEPAHSFGDLRSRIRLGDKVQLAEKGGKETEGRIAGLSESSLALRINGTVQTFPETGIQKISHRQHVSLLKSAVFGALAGGGTLMVICGMNDNSDSGRCAGDPAAIFAASAGIGALSGVGVAMMVRGSESIFESTERGKIKAVSTFNRSQRAVALAISF